MTEATLEQEQTTTVSADSSASRRVLMLCYHYPPRQNGGVERSRQFARLLPTQGWDPIVLTVRRSGDGKSDAEGRVVRTPQWNPSTIKAWLRGLLRRGGDAPSTIGAPRARTWRRDLIEHIYFPDPEITWALPALRTARRLIRRESIDTIYSTSPPESSHLLAFLLKRFTGLPWVMDLRDPWSFESLKKPVRTFAPRRWLEGVVERQCFACANRVIVNTPEAAAAYRERYPDLAEKIAVITNGLDLEELERVRASTDDSRWRAQREGAGLLFAHTGTFCRLGWKPATLRPFFEALRRLIESDVAGSRDARFVFAGPIDPTLQASVDAFGLGGRIEMPGSLDHAEALELLDAADRLVLYDPSDDGETYVRGKLYEYLAACKPIIGVVPQGASRRLLLESGHELLAAPDDRAAIEAVMGRAMSGERLSVGELDPSRLCRARLCADLARELDAASRRAFEHVG